MRLSGLRISASLSTSIFTFTSRPLRYVRLTFTLAVTQECSVKSRERKCSSAKRARLTLGRNMVADNDLVSFFLTNKNHFKVIIFLPENPLSQCMISVRLSVSTGAIYSGV